MAAIPDSSAHTPTVALGFENTFTEEVPGLTVPWHGVEAPDPALLALNENLAASLGLAVNVLRTDEGIAVLSGAAAPADTTPVAMAYAGHQFGGYAPLLGDGRALLLGELVGTDGQRVDLHLKGSGPTGGDGFAVVGPMLREYLVSEAMHALGIPTTRSLSVVATGRPVHRDGVEPGAVLARIASGHLRVGTFELAARQGDIVRTLADYAITRHYPHLAERPEPGEGNRYLAFLERADFDGHGGAGVVQRGDAVVEAQASLVAQWMLVGLVHGVMNTDNTTISGETIDYGPCAFLDAYHLSAALFHRPQRPLCVRQPARRPEMGPGAVRRNPAAAVRSDARRRGSRSDGRAQRVRRTLRPSLHHGDVGQTRPDRDRRRGTDR